MKEYIVPELQYIDFSAEEITSSIEGDQGTSGAEVTTSPWEDFV